MVWGVNPPDDCGPCVTIALDRLDRVLEIDEVSRARAHPGRRARARASRSSCARAATRCATSRSRSASRSLGGWIATRSGGHYATNHTHIDDFVESVRMLTPQGWWESRRLPG